MNKMSDGFSNAYSVLEDIPNEILLKIIFNLDATNRMALADSCTRLNSLVFECRDLWRDLDFSENFLLTTPSDIQKYFDDENMCDIVRRVNIQNVRCMKPGKMLNDSIGRAINLVDINIHGIKFTDIGQLASLLIPLIHLKRLSVDWPQSVKTPSAICKVLKKPFCKLTYLSVELNLTSGEFLPVLNLCKNLEELRLVVTPFFDASMHWGRYDKGLRSLKIVQVRESLASGAFGSLKYTLMRMIPGLGKWTDFRLIDLHEGKGFYLEKDLEICPELLKTELFEFQLGVSSLTSESLLSKAIGITYENVPEEFCCLKRSPMNGDNEHPDESREPCLLKIEEAKRLLKDPDYRISFLYLNHKIEPDCDAHLVVSAFPNLTELVLSDILKSEDGVSTEGEKKHYQRRLRRKGDTSSEEQDDPKNMDSSFKMIIENTPRVEKLTIWGQSSYWREDEKWDLEALHLIPLWKCLRILRLAHVPVNDGKLFIHIGKECPQLEKIALRDLDLNRPCSYISNLSEMLLNHLRNLKEFSIFEQKLIKLPELFASLSKNLNLRSVRLTTGTHGEPYDFEKVISSIEQLLHRCTELIIFKCVTLDLPHGLYTDPLAPALERIKAELNRPKFQFQTTRSDSEPYSGKTNSAATVLENVPTSFFAWKMDVTDF